MTPARQETRARGAAAGKAAAITELMLEVAQCFFRIRALGKQSGLITSWGAGSYGFLRTLALHGPQTVPQIASLRPTSRQRMQRLADELAADRLVRFVDNPRHRRSKLVQLTARGQARYRAQSAQLLAIASTMGAALREADIRETTEVVRRLSEDVKARSPPPRRSKRGSRAATPPDMMRRRATREGRP